jgi:exosome complex RNA-binding protein Rrp42 (RNase PH superfamily)
MSVNRRFDIDEMEWITSSYNSSHIVLDTEYFMVFIDMDVLLCQNNNSDQMKYSTNSALNKANTIKKNFHFRSM